VSRRDLAAVCSASECLVEASWVSRLESVRRVVSSCLANSLRSLRQVSWAVLSSDRAVS